MSAFELKSALPHETRREIDRIQAISSGQRTTKEAAFLTALAPYLTNEVMSYDAAGDIIRAGGETLPSGYTGFAKGAVFVLTNAADGTKGLYENVGTTTDADWNLIGEISTAEIGDEQVTAAKLAAALDLAGKALTSLSIEEGTPVNAVAAAQTLTLVGAITPGTHAESVVTANTILDGDTLTINATVYRFKTTPAQAYDVALGANDAAALDNLKLAINANGVGDGSDYFAGTVAHPDVVATDNTDTTQKVVARVPGTAANALATTSSGATLAWEDTTLGGGTGNSTAGVAAETVTIDGVVYSFVDVLSETNGADAIVNQVLFGADSAAALDNLKLAINGGETEGTNYSTGTVAHTTVTATTNTNTEQTVEAQVKGTAAESIAVSDTISNGDWGDTNLANGVDGTVGNEYEILVDASYLYVAVAANTVADTNWRRVSLGTAY